MKIEYHNYCVTVDQKSIDQFADHNGLVMVINEYHHLEETPYRVHFHAYFKSGEIRRGSAGLLSTFGIGDTVDEAIADYAKKISNQLLIINATGPDRREIRVPQLFHTKAP